MMSEATNRNAGSTILAGFDGTSLPEDLARECEEGLVAGVVLFRRNVDSAAQVAQLIASVKERFGAQRPAVVAVDQEGGRVVRLREPLTVLPAAGVFGEIDDPELTRRAGALVGRELRALGFTVDFAPVMDVNTNPSSPVIGDRAYGG